MKLPFIYALTLIAAVSLGAEPQTKTLTQALEDALARSPDVMILQSNVEVGEANAQVAAAKNGFGLSANGSYGASQALGDPVLGVKLSPGAVDNLSHNLQGSLALGIGSTKAALSGTHSYVPDTKGNLNQSTQVGLSLTQTLWDGYAGGSGQAAVDKSLINLDIVRLNGKNARTALISRVKLAYFNLAAAQEAQGIYLQALAQKRFLLTLIQTKFDLHQASSIDLKEAQINFRSAELDAQAGRSAVKSARQRLIALTLWPEDLDFQLSNEDPGPVPVKTLEEALAIAYTQRTDLKLLELNQRITGIDQSLVAGQVLPTVAVAAGANWSMDWATSKSAESLNASVKVGLPLIDGGLALSQIAAAMKQSQVFSMQQEILKKTIAADVEDALSSHQVKLSRWELAQLTVEKLQSQYDITKTKYEMGTANNNDLMTAELNLSNGRLALAKAKIDAKTAQITLETALGN